MKFYCIVRRKWSRAKSSSWFCAGQIYWTWPRSSMV